MSFCGGRDPDSGRIIDVHHPQVGAEVAGRIRVRPGTRGSVSGPGTLTEAVRLGSGPCGIILPAPDVAMVSAVAEAEALLAPFPTEALTHYRVLPRLNSPAHDDPALIEPLDAPAEAGGQPRLL